MKGGIKSRSKRGTFASSYRVKDRQLVDAQSPGLLIRTQETDDPQTRDVIIDVKEGQTGTVRFACCSA